jgi:hypothetical protein
MESETASWLVCLNEKLYEQIDHSQTFDQRFDQFAANKSQMTVMSQRLPIRPHL